MCMFRFSFSYDFMYTRFIIASVIIYRAIYSVIFAVCVCVWCVVLIFRKADNFVLVAICIKLILAL